MPAACWRTLPWCVVLVIAGCHTAPRPPVETGTGVKTSTTVGWPFWPVSMRMHPLTRIIEDDQTGQPVIEARVEFTDGDAVTTRCVGTLYLELHAGQQAAPGEPLDRWRIDLIDQVVNSTHFDVVTRTYLLKLRLSLPALPESCELWVFLASADGRQFSDSMELER